MENNDEFDDEFDNINYQDKDKFCFTCNNRSKDLLKCAKCNNIYYCGAVCQKKDWASHKNICDKERNIELLNSLLDRIMKTGIYFYTISACNKYVINSYDTYFRNLLKINEETKIMG